MIMVRRSRRAPNVGKPEIGKIVLNAYHEGGHIIIEIADDGRGLNIEKFAVKSFPMAWPEAEVDAMTGSTNRPVYFQGGLSTAEKVTVSRTRRRHGCGSNQYRKDQNVELKTVRYADRPSRSRFR